MQLSLSIDLLSEVLVIRDQYPILFERFSDNSLSSIPRACSYTEKTSWRCSRSHLATAGPVHSSTRNRIQVISMANGMKTILSNDLVANTRQA